MAFSDALDLRTAVFETIKDATRADEWPRMVSLAESRLNRAIRHHKGVSLAEINVVDGVGQLPADFVEMVSINRGGHPMKEVTITTRDDWPSDAYCYAVLNGNLYTAGTYSQPIRYYAALPTLANDLDATNWLLQEHPHVYLYAVCVEMAAFADKAGFEQLLGYSMRDLRRAQNRAVYGNSVVTPVGATP